MSTELLTAIAALIVSLGGIVAGVLTFVQNRKGAEATNALEERKVNREDFDSIARERASDITRLREDVDQLREDLAGEREARRAAEHRAEVAEERADHAEERACRLESRVDQLEDAMRLADLTIPDAPT